MRYRVLENGFLVRLETGEPVIETLTRLLAKAGPTTASAQLAWLNKTEPSEAPLSLLTVYPTEDMNMRTRPMVCAKRIGRPAHNAPLTVHDDPARARALVGRYDEWLYVETAEGQRGWVAAWYVSTTPT